MITSLAVTVWSGSNSVSPHADCGVSSRAPRFYALNACAIQQAHTRGNLTSTVCCFGKPCLNTRLQLLCVLVSSLEPHGVVPPSSGRTVLQVPMGQANCAKTRSQSVDRSSLHTFGAVWIKPLARLPELGLVSTGLIRRSSRRVCAAVTDRNSVLRGVYRIVTPKFAILLYHIFRYLCQNIRVQNDNQRCRHGHEAGLRQAS